MKKSTHIQAIINVLIVLLYFAGSVSAQSSKKTSFNIISYNIRMNTPNDSANAWPLRKDKVSGLLRFHQADIFNIQEALPEQMDDLIAAFPDFDHVGVGRDDGKRSGEHMSIFYRKNRFNKLDDGVFWLNETPQQPGKGWDAAHNRTVTWIKLKDKISGKAFYVFNTHFDNQGKIAREKSAAFVLKMMKEINKEGLALIFTGDLNAIKSSAPVQTLLSYLDDAMEKTTSPHYGPENTSGGFAVKVLSRKIDYILVNNKITALRHAHLSDSFGLFYPSDHLPVFASILLK